MYKKYILALVVCYSPELLADEKWSYKAEFYGEAINISGTAALPQDNGIPIEMDHSTFFNNLDFGGMLNFEAQSPSGWGFALDWAIADLDNSGTTSYLRSEVTYKASVRQQVTEFFVFHPINQQWDAFMGARAWNNNLALNIDFRSDHLDDISTQASDDWVDPYLGVRWSKQLSKSWLLKARADIGGFGISSNFTSLVQVGAEYKLSPRWSFDMRYRGLWVDYTNGKPDSENYFVYDATTYGATIGIIARF